MKIVSIVGARPQFIKAAVLCQELRKRHTEVLVHTGQHYDAGMSDVFFNELGIPAPDYHLAIGSGAHGLQTGQMLIRIEEVLLKEKPDGVLIYGDTNSTLAGALAAAKLLIPVVHVEAGLRSFNRAMPEELNRVVADQLSALLFCPTQTAVENLRKEGITLGVHLVGDVMADGLLLARDRARKDSRILEALGLSEKKYLLATVHRAENTDDPSRLRGIFQALEKLAEQEPVVMPLHPRTRRALRSLDLAPSRLRLIEPAAYLDMVRLEESARMILTDSGGVQKEAYWMQVPCVTLRDETEWVELLEDGWNRLAGADPHRIVDAVLNGMPPGRQALPGGDGQTAARCVALMERGLSTK